MTLPCDGLLKNNRILDLFHFSSFSYSGPGSELLHQIAIDPGHCMQPLHHILHPTHDSLETDG
jgi:hypothetical protein